MIPISKTVERMKIGLFLLSLMLLKVSTSSSSAETSLSQNKITRMVRQTFDESEDSSFEDEPNFLETKAEDEVKEVDVGEVKEEVPKEHRSKTDPQFDRRMKELEAQYRGNPFMMSMAKYFVRNRAQKRERRSPQRNRFEFYPPRNNFNNGNYLGDNGRFNSPKRTQLRNGNNNVQKRKPFKPMVIF